MKVIYLFLITFLLPNFSFCQRGPSISMDYEIPMGSLGEVYKPALNYTLSHVSFKKKQVWNISLGFYRFEPKENPFIYFNGDETVVAKYSKYSVLPLYIGLGHNFSISDHISIQLGMDMGYYYTWYSYSVEGRTSSGINTINIGGDVIQGRGDISPKINLLIKLTDIIHFQIRSKFNLFYALGSQDSESINYNPYAGSFNTSTSNGIGLVFLFNKD